MKKPGKGQGQAKQDVKKIVLNFAVSLFLHFTCLQVPVSKHPFVSGMCFGVALTSIILYLRKDKPEN